MRTLTPEQRQKTEERRERFRQFVKQVSAMTPEQRQRAFDALPVPILTVEGRALSIHNTLLLVAQRPGVTLVGGFKQWLGHGRVVRKGESGLMLWFPASKKGQTPSAAAPDGTPDETRFYIGTVFDVSQTVELSEEKAA